MSNLILSDIRKALLEQVDEKSKNNFQRVFKEKIQYHGVRSPAVDKVAKKYFNHVKDKGKREIFRLCEELLKSNYCEEEWIAANWAYWVRKEYKSIDITTFERWIDRYITNWASCDTLCNHAVGTFIEQYPEHVKRLKKWATSKNLWMRRAAAVTLIIPAKHGMFLDDVFQIADILLMDTEDLVQKGYGWMLKAASQAHQKEVFEFVIKHKKEMPRTALRYAIEKMPMELKKKAMESWFDKRVKM